MFRFLEDKFKEILTSLVLVLILVTITTTHRLDNKLRWYDKAVMFVTAPLQFGLTTVIKGGVRFFDNYLFVIDVKKDNRFLIAENRKLLQKVNQLKEVEYENSRLRRLLLFKEKISPFMLPAEVIAKDASVEFKTIRINKGKSNGIKLAMPVVNYEGVVGQIIRVSSKYSDVLVITDPNFAIDSLVQRSRARGVVEGRSGSIGHMKYLNRLDDVKVSDKIVSSGLAGRFPKGILVGEVTKTKRKKYGVTQLVEVRPSVNFGKLEEVFVIIRNK